MARARLQLVSLVCASIVIAAVPAAQAQESSGGTYTLNQAASAVGFSISGSMIVKVKEKGSFKQFDGSLSYDPGRPADTHLDLTVYTASVDTHSVEHNDLLKSGEF